MKQKEASQAASELSLRGWTPFWRELRGSARKCPRCRLATPLHSNSPLFNTTASAAAAAALVGGTRMPRHHLQAPSGMAILQTAALQQEAPVGWATFMWLKFPCPRIRYAYCEASCLFKNRPSLLCLGSYFLTIFPTLYVIVLLLVLSTSSYFLSMLLLSTHHIYPHGCILLFARYRGQPPCGRSG